MLLAIDVGNTDTVFGLYSHDSWQYIWRNPSGIYADTQSFLKRQAAEANLDLKAIDKTVLSSVVPGVTPALQAILNQMKLPPPLLVGPGLYTQLAIKIDNPEEIGSDLVANATAAYAYFQQACIVVDFGTALTFTLVDQTGSLLGVSIAPGLKTAMRALFANTAQLPEVPLALPEAVIGKNTTQALQAGILYGYIGLVKEMLMRIKAFHPEPLAVVATGGLSAVLTPLHDHFDLVDKCLTLDGLRILCEKFG